MIPKNICRSFLNRRDFVRLGSLSALLPLLLPHRTTAAECQPTSADILGPYFSGSAPTRSVIAHVDEPGERLLMSGRVLASDCFTPISGAMVEVWHANHEGSYSINQACTAGNPAHDAFNLRGRVFSDANGLYAFETIKPAPYSLGGSSYRPSHIHYKVTVPNGPELITQLYFEDDPYIGGDPWASNATDRIIPLSYLNAQIHGAFDIVMNTENNGVQPGDINKDGSVDHIDLEAAIQSVIKSDEPDDHFQEWAADLKLDQKIDVRDIVKLVQRILS